jgi:hypothetical protein
MAVSIYVFAGPGEDLEVHQHFYDQPQLRPHGWVEIISGGQGINLSSIDAARLESLGYKLLDAAQKAREHEARHEVARLAESVAVPA